MKREEMTPEQLAVSNALDDWMGRKWGKETSDAAPEWFLESLNEHGYRVESNAVPVPAESAAYQKFMDLVLRWATTTQYGAASGELLGSLRLLGDDVRSITLKGLDSRTENRPQRIAPCSNYATKHPAHMWQAIVEHTEWVQCSGVAEEPGTKTSSGSNVAGFEASLEILDELQDIRLGEITRATSSSFEYRKYVDVDCNIITPHEPHEWMAPHEYLPKNERGWKEAGPFHARCKGVLSTRPKQKDLVQHPVLPCDDVNPHEPHNWWLSAEYLGEKLGLDRWDAPVTGSHVFCQGKRIDE